MSHDPECSYCNGTGWFLWHSPACDDDLCALNGDEHSCAGEMQECDCKAPDAPAQDTAAQEVLPL